MRLSDFIRQSVEEIVAVSVAFAGKLPPMSGASIDPSVLRDHLPVVLQAIANDLDSPQTTQQSITKSEGGAPTLQFETAAQTHGRLRADNGLTVAQLVAEYRVLRAAVLRLWLEGGGGLGPDAAADVARFNEAIDQAVAESVAFHSAAVDRWRQILLAAIGHDLRGPLNAIVLTTEVLSAGVDERMSVYTKTLQRSANRMSELLDSLLEYNRSLLGAAMTLHRKPVDLGAAARDEIEQLRIALPKTPITLETHGDAAGDFDANRVREALANLVFNAAQYSARGSNVIVVVTGRADHVLLAVQNEGEPIDPQVLASLFEPLRRRASPERSERRNLGLGLFIVREIAKAHGGDVQARAEGGKVEFSVRLPKSI